MKVVIVGAGASGLMAAIAAAERGCKVCVLECKDKPAKKIYATGNGKCNLTNRSMSPDCYRSDDPEKILLKNALHHFGEADTRRFFEKRGLLLKERDGYVYPSSGQAATVVQCLLEACRRAGVEIRCNSTVTKIEKKEGRYQISLQEKETKEKPVKNKTEMADAVMIAVGTGAGGFGCAYDAGKITEGLGISMVKERPSLCGLKCREKAFFSKVSGVRCDAEIHLFAVENGKKQSLAIERGELQLTEYGLSGIPVFQISGYAARALEEGKKVTAVISYLPDFSREMLGKHFLKTEKDTLRFDFSMVFHEKIVNAVISCFPEIKTAESMIEKLKHMEVLVVSCHSANAQVYAGGVDTRALDMNFQSKRHKNLYFIGEATDVDGICGGYNLQYAWSSGYIAGCHVAEKRKK